MKTKSIIVWLFAAIIASVTVSPHAFAGQLLFDGVPVDITTNDGEDLLIVPGEGGNTQVGDIVGSQLHALTNDDLYVTGLLETDGTIYADEGLIAGYHLLPAEDATVDLGSTSLSWRNLFVGTISGYNDNLNLSPSSGYSLIGTVTKNATSGDETAFLLSAGVNKASGSYTGLKLSMTETSAPGGSNKLLDMVIGTTSYLQVYTGDVSTDYGLLSVGSGSWNGSALGHFVGAAGGTQIAVNTPSTFSGNLIDLQVNGVTKFYVDANGNVYAAGTLGGGGAVTGSGTANRIARWATGSSLANGGISDSSSSVAMTIDSTGNVGIGAAAPSGKLDVEGGDVFIGTGTLTNASVSEDLSVTGNLEVDGLIYGDGSQLTNLPAASGWTDDGTEIRLSDATDNVGIGTSLPSGKLDVEGGDVFIGTGTLTNASVSEDLSVTGNLEVDGTLYPGSINGYVIGTNIQAYDLDLADLADGILTGSKVQQQMSITSDASGLKLSGDATLPGNSKYYGTDGSGTKGFFDLGMSGWTDDGTDIRLSTSTDNVGIGTSAPSGKLDIEGGDVFIGTGTLTNASVSEDLSVTGNLEVDGTLYPGAINGYAIGTDIQAYDLDLADLADGILTGSKVQQQMSITSDGSGLKLSGDATLPGNSKYYGTDGSGTKGYFDLGVSGWTDGGTNVYNTTLTDNVGIGTSDTSAGKLTIKGAGTTTGVGLQTQNSSGTPVLTTLDSGKVGIGTYLPDETLTVLGDGRFSSNLRTDQSMTVGGNLAVAGNTLIDPFGAGLYYINSDGTFRLKDVIDHSSGNIGIGTTVPGTKLDVTGLTINTNATGAVGAANFTTSLTKDDTNTRTFSGLKVKPTFDTGSSNTNTTFNILDIDSTNTATTGLTAYLLKASYGGLQKFAVDSSGNTTLNSQGDLRLADSDSSNYVAFQSAAVVASDITWTLPSADSAGCFQSNGIGTISISPCTAGDDVNVNGVGATDANFVNTAASGTVPSITWNLNTTPNPDAISISGVGAASATEAGVVTTGTQTIAGVKTFNDDLGIGGSYKTNLWQSDADLAVHGGGGVGLFTWTNTFDGPDLTFQHSRGASVGTHVASQLDDELGYMSFGGSDGVAFQESASIGSYIDGAVAADSVPGRLIFSTTAAGDQYSTERMRITSAGDVGIGTTVPSAKLQVIGDTALSGVLLANGADVFGSAPFVLKQNTSNNGIVITDNAATNPKTAFLGWNSGASFDYLNIEAVHQGVAFKPIALAPNGGDVGIGTTVPAGRLDVQGGPVIVGTGTNTNAAGAGELYVQGDLEVDGLIYGNGSQLTNITAAGGWTDGGANIYTTTLGDNVGIGTSTTTAGKLTIKGAGTTTGVGLQTQDSTGAALVTTLDSGRVGIGTTNPSQLLDVNGYINLGTVASSSTFGLAFQGRTDQGFFQNNIGNNVFISSLADLRVNLDSNANDTTAAFTIGHDGNDMTGGTELFRLQENGNVGIGSTSPLSRLDVSGLTINTDATGAVGAANFTTSLTKDDTNVRAFSGLKIKPTFDTGSSNTNTTFNVLDIDSTNTAVTGLTTNLIKASYGGTQVFGVDSSGNLLLKARGDLRLEDDTGGEYIALEAPTGVTTHTLTLPAANATGVLTNNGSGTLSWAAAASGDDVSVGGSAANGANFANTAATGTVPSVTWNLNTTPNPDDVTISAIGAASATEAGVVTTGAQTLAGSKTLTGNNTLIKPGVDSVTAFQIQPSGSLVPVLSIDTTNSRVGIGTSSPAAGVGLEVVDSIRSASNLELSYVWSNVGWNTNYNSGWKYIGDGPASRIEQDGDVGGLNFYSAGLGTAGNAISENLLMTMNSNGNVGIGTSVPTHKLQVNGAIYSKRYTLTDGPTVNVDWNNGNVQHVTLGGNRIITFTNGQDGGKYTLIIKQDGSGGKTVTWPASARWPSNRSPELTSAASRSDYFGFIYNAVDSKYDNVAQSKNF